MANEKVEIHTVWHLFKDRYQAALFTLAGLECDDYERFIGRSWNSLPVDTKIRIIELLDNAVGDV